MLHVLHIALSPAMGLRRLVVLHTENGRGGPGRQNHVSAILHKWPTLPLVAFVTDNVNRFLFKSVGMGKAG